MYSLVQFPMSPELYNTLQTQSDIHNEFCSVLNCPILKDTKLSSSLDFSHEVSIDLDWDGYQPYFETFTVGKTNDFPEHSWEEYYNGKWHSCGDGGNRTNEIIFNIVIPYNGLDWHVNQAQFSVISDQDVSLYIYDATNSILLNPVNSDKEFQSGIILTEGNSYNIVVEANEGAKLKVAFIPQGVNGSGVFAQDEQLFGSVDHIYGTTTLTENSGNIVYSINEEIRPNVFEEVSFSNYFSKEAIYSFAAPISGKYTFTLNNLTGRSYDPDFFLFTENKDSYASSNSWDQDEVIECEMKAGEKLRLVVDGWNDKAIGEFKISVQYPNFDNTQFSYAPIGNSVYEKDGNIIIDGDK